MPGKHALLPRLKKRADFLRASKGDRFHARAFTLQASKSDDTAELPEASSRPDLSFTGTHSSGPAPSVSARIVLENPAPVSGTLEQSPVSDLLGEVPAARFGITVTKRVGNAVQRNRMRRRFKEALRLAPGLADIAGRDYVIVAKAEALNAGFAALQSELLMAIRKIGRPARARPPADQANQRKPGTNKSGRKTPQGRS